MLLHSAYRPSLDLDLVGMVITRRFVTARKGASVYNLDAGLEAPTFVISLYSNLFIVSLRFVNVRSLGRLTM